MKKSIFLFLCITAMFLVLTVNAGALTVTNNSNSTASVTIASSIVGTTITITENWETGGDLFLEFNGLEEGTNYTVVKEITNNTGTTWTRFANELLDPAGQGNDDRDPKPYPGYVPSDFTTSNDYDGLSFAQGSGLPRTSTIFDSVFADELGDARDFLDFFDGSWGGEGMLGTITFGLRDNGTNQGFLLAQRPNEFSKPVPEPATMLLLGAGLLGLAGLGRKKFSKKA